MLNEMLLYFNIPIFGTAPYLFSRMTYGAIFSAIKRYNANVFGSNTKGLLYVNCILKILSHKNSECHCLLTVLLDIVQPSLRIYVDHYFPYFLNSYCYY